MSLLARAMLINVAATGGAGLMAMLIFSLSLKSSFQEMPSALWILVAMNSLGLFVHAIFMERWMRPASRLERLSANGLAQGRHPFRDLRDLAAFPVRSFLFSAVAWILLIFLGVSLFSLTVNLSSYELYVITAILISVGSWAWILQLFLNRRLVIPVIEKFLNRYPDLWRHDDPFFTQSMFPVRAKWIILSLFLIGFALFITVVFTASWVRGVAEDDSFRMLERRVDAMQVMLEEQIDAAGSIATNPKGWDRIGKRMDRWLQAEAWIQDSDGRVLVAPLHKIDLADVLRNRRYIERHLARGRILIAVPRLESGMESIIRYFWVYLFVLLATGVAVSIVAILVGRDLAGTLRRLKQLTSQYDEGDFRIIPPVASEDDLGSIGLTLRAIRDLLRTVLMALKHSGEIFHESNSEILQSSAHLVQVSGEQKRTLQQMAGLLSDLGTTYGNQFDELGNLRQTLDRSLTSIRGSESRFGAMERQLSTTVEVADRFGENFGELTRVQEMQGEALQLWRDTANSVTKRTERLVMHAVSLVDHLDRIHNLQSVRLRRQENQQIRIARLNQEISRIGSVIGGLERFVERVGENLGDMVESLSWVNEIGDDTRLLSLNAAILSAKAAEEGRSFSVIAANIAELADFSEKSVLQLHEAIGGFSHNSYGLQEQIGELKEGMKLFLEQYDELQQLENEASGLVQQESQQERQARNQATYFQEKHSALQAQQDASRSLLDGIAANFANQRFCFDEMQGRLKLTSSRIADIKGHTQYQLARARTMIEALQKIQVVVSEVLSSAGDHLAAMHGLSEVGQQIIEAVSRQVEYMESLESRLKEFDESTRNFITNLNRFRLGEM